MAVTLVEIASLAGVSRGTVDRALNNRGRVDPEVAERVRRIAAELGYRPNREGRSLLAKNPIKIGIIVQSVETMFMHMVFEEVMRTQAQLTTPARRFMFAPFRALTRTVSSPPSTSLSPSASTDLRSLRRQMSVSVHGSESFRPKSRS